MSEQPPQSREIDPTEALIHVRAGGVSLLLDARGPRLPRVLHWGADLGDADQATLHDLAMALVPPRVSGLVDGGITLSVLPEHAMSWPGRPGLTGHRRGRDWSPLFDVQRVTVRAGAGSQLVVVTARDTVAALALEIDIELLESGLMRLRARIRNESPRDYDLTGLLLALPVPSVATEILDLTGRHLRERSPQRQPFTMGTRTREGRRGRTGLDATLVLAAGVDGFGFERGEVWGIHVAWSGNHRFYAEQIPNGLQVVGGGELLLPGEVILGEGEEYESPWLLASYGDGLDELSARFHESLRARAGHPNCPRPVVLNTWEAVYFDQDPATLISLADAGAEVGVERFVLDDGWFRHRRDDTAGLGDWYVDESIWPNGLGPLVNHVHRLGMQFGLWVEPEMINPDSDLARAHPDWIAATGGRLPLEWRNQQVLDLTHPEAFAYILQRLDTLVAEYGIEYLKWDHNRDPSDAGHQPGGEAVVHGQTLAVYRLLDELRRRHPTVEIESCASGGGRVDLGILERTDRIWGSDCNDALERQSINRWTTLLVPPELLGAHVGAEHTHTTERTHSLDFRAGTAIFGHFGLELDLTKLSVDERARVAEWVWLYRRIRSVLHTGRVVRVDHPDPAILVHGVVAQDRSEAVFAVVAVATSVSAPPGRIRLPGLDPDRHYRIAPLAPGDDARGVNQIPAPWLAKGELTLTGRLLSTAGVQGPDLYPENLILLHATLADR